MLDVGKAGRISTCWFFNCKASTFSSSMVSYKRRKTVAKSSVSLSLIIHYVLLWVHKRNLLESWMCVRNVCMCGCMCVNIFLYHFSASKMRALSLRAFRYYKHILKREIHFKKLLVYVLISKFGFSFPMARQPLGGLGLLIFRGFAITHLRHTTLGRTPLDDSKFGLLLTKTQKHLKASDYFLQLIFEYTISIKNNSLKARLKLCN
jgi:hypothetical protein